MKKVLLKKKKKENTKKYGGTRPKPIC